MAKKFKFSLESVLNLKNHRAKEAKDLLQQAANIRTKKEQTISENQEYLKSISNTGNRMSLQELQDLHYHKESVKHIIIKLEKEKSQIVEIENLRRDKLSDAMKEEKILTKLKDNKILKYKDELKKEENSILDEIASRTSGGKD